MAWTMEGTYFETCSCETICPCTWSGMTATATHDRCRAMLAFHIDRGDVEGTDVGGLSFAMVIDAPPVMVNGDWRVGVVLDGNGNEDQLGALGRVLGGELGGPPATLGPLIGEMLGAESAPATWSQGDGTFSVRFGDLIDVEVKDFVAGEMAGPVQLFNIDHPASATLTLSPNSRTKVDVFGIKMSEVGTSGFNAPFSWSA